MEETQNLLDAGLLGGLIELGQGEWRITLTVCLLSLLAVWWPLTKGAVLCFRARAATRISKGRTEEAPSGLVSSRLREVYAASSTDLGDEQPEAFVRDAVKQIVVEDYESNFAHPISMYANILPPIGFIGTTCGLAILLLSMRLSHNALQMGALALALSSTIFALVGYALLESAKIHLYGRLAKSIHAGFDSAA